MTIGRFFGVKFRLNLFFLILLLLYLLMGVLPYGLIAFAVVFIHEMAHSITARILGLKVTEVELLPFGGVARIEDFLEADPKVEMLTAAVGPLSNLVLIVGAVIGQKTGLVESQFLPFFIKVNAMIGIFNLIPALPLDGGRIYRAFMAQRIGFKEATEQAVNNGKLFAIIFVCLGTIGMYYRLTGFDFFIIAIFLYYSAAKEKGYAMLLFLRHLTRKKDELRKSGVLPIKQIVVEEETLLKDIIKHFVPKKFHLILVLDQNMEVAGVLTEYEIIEDAFSKGLNLKVKDSLEEK